MNADTTTPPTTTDAPEDPTPREVDDEIDVVDEEEAEETAQIKAELEKKDKGERP
jgi:hypothetical protein